MCERECQPDAYIRLFFFYSKLHAPNFSSPFTQYLFSLSLFRSRSRFTRALSRLRCSPARFIWDGAHTILHPTAGALLPRPAAWMMKKSTLERPDSSSCVISFKGCWDYTSLSFLPSLCAPCVWRFFSRRAMLICTHAASSEMMQAPSIYM